MAPSPPPRARPTPELRISDIEAFIGVARFGTINGASRGLETSASRLSKSIARLERALGSKVIARSAQGVELTEAGRDLLPRLLDLLDRAQGVRSGRPEVAHLTVVAPSFLTAQFLPSIVASIPSVSIRSVDAAPGIMSAYVNQPLFDLALTIRAQRWPPSWVQSVVGSLRLGLFASPAAAARLGGRRVPADRLRQETFIGPLYSNGSELVIGDDGCPLGSARTFGHRTQTLAMALALAETTNQLVFGPALAALAPLARGSLVEIQVEGWNVREQLYLECHQQRVSAPVQRAVLAALREALRPLEASTR